MWTDKGLRDLLAAFVKEYGAKQATMLGIVKDVDLAECTCTLTDDGADYFGVRLLPVTGANKSFLQVPKKGAFGLAVRVENTEEWMLVSCSEIEKIQIIINNESVYSIASDLIKAIRAMVFTTNAGPSIRLINDLDFAALQTRINKILS